MQPKQSTLQLEERRLLSKVAYLYHELRLKQSAIAQQLDVSQSTVSRLLKRAELEGIVQIVLRLPQGIYTPLENQLREQYHLKSCIIVDCEDPDDTEAIQRYLGQAAAYYIETTLGSSEIVGISSWSSTLLAMVDAQRPLSWSTHAKVVQILGGVGNPSAEIYASRLTERFSKIINADAIYLPAPGVAASRDTRDVLLHDPFVREALDKFDHITLALVGIGALEPSVLLARSGNVFSKEELDTLRHHGAVGDISLRFFDLQGSPVITPLDERVISIRLDQLKKVRRSVGIAGGRRKHLAIKSALIGGWINVLITDRFTAEYLISADANKETGIDDHATSPFPTHD